MHCDRRQLLFAGGAWLAGCRHATPARPIDHESLRAAHAAAWPENGGGANHFPMAVDVLEAWERADAVPGVWAKAAATYGTATSTAATPLWQRFVALRDGWRDQLAHGDGNWRTTLAAALPPLVPGCTGALWHGLLRTAHACRSLTRADTPARRDELATALAYWQVRQVTLTPNGAPIDPAAPLVDTLRTLHGSGAPSAADVDFAGVMPRLLAAPTIPPATAGTGAPLAELLATAHGAAAGLGAMLQLERHRVWHLHAVTAPAAALLLLPHLDASTARQLAAVVRQGVIALFAAFGTPFATPVDDGRRLPTWPELRDAAVATASVHTLKLVEALERCRDAAHDRRLRAVAQQWLAWR